MGSKFCTIALTPCASYFGFTGIFFYEEDGASANLLATTALC